MINRMDKRNVSVRSNGSLRIKTINEEPTMTQQQFKDDCDVNMILRKHGHDPVAFQALTRPGGIYADFSNITDYREMLDTVMTAQDAFAALPAHLRYRFGNDPSQLLAFVQDKKNYDEGVKLGIINPPTKPVATPNDESNDDKGATVTPKK
jgi:phage internal scaffolding protein